MYWHTYLIATRWTQATNSNSPIIPQRSVLRILVNKGADQISIALFSQIRITLLWSFGQIALPNTLIQNSKHRRSARLDIIPSRPGCSIIWYQQPVLSSAAATTALVSSTNLICRYRSDFSENIFGVDRTSSRVSTKAIKYHPNDLLQANGLAPVTGSTHDAFFDAS